MVNQICQKYIEQFYHLLRIYYTLDQHVKIKLEKNILLQYRFNFLY